LALSESGERRGIVGKPRQGRPEWPAGKNLSALRCKICLQEGLSTQVVENLRAFKKHITRTVSFFFTVRGEEGTEGKREKRQA